MDIKTTMKKGLENILVTMPLWGIAGVMTVSILTNPKPIGNCYFNNSEYHIFRNDKETAVCTGGVVAPRQLIDNGNDGTVDIYNTGIIAPRRYPILITVSGKDIPSKIQNEFDDVMKYFTENNKNQGF